MKKLLLAVLLVLPLIASAEKLYQEGSVHTNADLGNACWAVRNDSGTPLAADGRYIPFTADAYGLQVSITGMGSVTNATFAPLDVTAFGSIGAAYALAVDLPDGTKVVVLDNQTNGDVMTSMNGGVSDYVHLKAGDVATINLATAGLITTAEVWIKDGTAPSTSGSFYVYSYK